MRYKVHNALNVLSMKNSLDYTMGCIILGKGLQLLTCKNREAPGGPV